MRPSRPFFARFAVKRLAWAPDTRAISNRRCLRRTALEINAREIEIAALYVGANQLHPELVANVDYLRALS